MNQSSNNSCPLCGSNSSNFFKNQFFVCDHCEGIFRSDKDFPDSDEEKLRYESHNNDVNDLGYQKFVSPIVERVLQDYSAKHEGLDFGSGTGAVISKLLEDQHYNIKQYDPFFENKPELLNDTYDYIVCCEVIEHFHDPQKEFHLLKRLLKPGAKLYVMTHIYTPDIKFDNWYYKNDNTHVFIYQHKTVACIKETYKFSALTVSDRLLVFTND